MMWWVRGRDRILDAVAVVVAAFVALAFAGEAEANGIVTGGALYWALVEGAAGCVALWWRRTYPVGVAVVLAPLYATTALVMVAVLIAVYTVAANRRWSMTVAVAGLHALAQMPLSTLRPDPDLDVVGTNAVSVALLSIAVVLGASVRSRRNRVAAMRERAARATAWAAMRDERLRARERERIAREMHDALAHRISLVSLHAAGLEVRPDLSTEEIIRAATIIRSNAHLALEDLRAILGNLQAGDEPAGPQPSLATLPELVDECRIAGTPVRVDDQLPDQAPPPLVSRAAYRIVQEGLTNVRKHAPGAPARLRLDRAPGGEVHILLQNELAANPDSGVPGARSGLVGLAERVRLAGGRLDHGVRRCPDGRIRFHLEAWLPWPL